MLFRRKNRPYERLPGRGMKALAVASADRFSLWLGDDHLLFLSESSITETYKRFYYRDIRAIQVNETSAGTIGTTILVGIAALPGLALLIGLAKDSGMWYMGVMGAIAAFFLLLAFVNWVRGPTCRCFLHTAVHRQELPSLTRMRKARKAFALLRTRIETVQGEFSEEMISRYESLVRQEPVLSRSRGRPGASGSDSARSGIDRDYGGRAHRLLFAFLLVDVCHSCIRLYVGGMAMAAAGYLIAILLTVSVVVALVKQYNSPVKTAVRRLVWAAFGYLVLMDAFGGVLYYVMVGSNPDHGSGSAAVFKSMAEMMPMESMPLLVLMLISIVAAFAIGLPGLVLMRDFRHREDRPPPVPLNLER